MKHKNVIGVVGWPLDGVTQRGLVPACCHLQFSAITTGFYSVQKASQHHLHTAILSRNNCFLLDQLFVV
jgi:hypothetical protein